MILTIVDNYDKQQGTNLPMFSRSGKSTINQYLAFNSGNKKRSVVHVNREEADNADFDAEDVDLIMGEKPNNLEEEM